MENETKSIGNKGCDRGKNGIEGDGESNEDGLNHKLEIEIRDESKSFPPSFLANAGIKFEY